MIEKGGSTAKIVPEIQRLKFTKNLWNLAFSAISTLTGYSLPAIFRAPPQNGEAYEPYVSDTTRKHIDEYTIPVIRAILEEALTLGARSLNYIYTCVVDEPQRVRWDFLTPPMVSHRLSSILH
jgi:2-dehydropantoate 2-reductase